GGDPTRRLPGPARHCRIETDLDLRDPAAQGLQPDQHRSAALDLPGRDRHQARLYGRRRLLPGRRRDAQRADDPGRRARQHAAFHGRDDPPRLRVQASSNPLRFAPMGGMGEIFKLGIPWTHLVLRAVIIYVVFFIGLRLFGKRELGQFTTFDLVLVLLVANALQPAITGPDQSVTGGAIIVAILLVFNRAVAMLRSRWPWFDALIEPPPTVVVADGQISKAALEKEGLSEDDVEMAIREHGVDKISDVKEAVLENDGSISVVTKGSGNRYRRRRRVRFLKR